MFTNEGGGEGFAVKDLKYRYKNNGERMYEEPPHNCGAVSSLVSYVTLFFVDERRV